MDELEKNIPDDFWRKAFDEASEAPPPRVWSAIESRLDESNGPKIVPLWGFGLSASRPLQWGMGVAAAMALFLVGWWAINTQSTNTGNRVAQVTESKQTDQTASNQAKSTPETTLADGTRQPDKQTTSESETLIADNNVATSTEKERIVAVEPNTNPVKASVGRRINQLNRPAFTPENRVTSRLPASERKASTPFDSPNVAMSLRKSGQNPVTSANYAKAASSQSSLTNTPIAQSAESVSGQNAQINELATSPMHLRSPGPIYRIVWFRPAELSVEPERSKSKHEAREAWASVSMMPGSFNPSVSIRSMQATALNTARSNQPSVNSRADFSVAYQAGAGVQLNKHWSIESGIGYLSGRSTVESPGSMYNYNSSLVASMAPQLDASTANNYYVSAVRNSIHQEANAASNYASPSNYDKLGNTVSAYQNYDNRYQQSVTNNFDYVQVPVQVGYQLLPSKRLGLSLLGGFLTNIFVRNTVGNDLVITSKDGVYRPLSVAASMGARFRYRPSQRWSASLAGMYQPSLGLGTRPESQIQSTPTSTGMSFGLDYHF